LFSIVYGEGVFNDIVSIILFETVQNLFNAKNDEFTWSTPFTIMGNFIILALSSLAVGLVAGVISSLLFKWFRFLCHSAITETLLIFIIAMTTYFVSEAAQLSGIISLLTCGITMAHYTWYNLSPQGKTISSVTVSIFGSAAEAVVFAYIGLCVFTYYPGANSGEEEQTQKWSMSFILWMTLIIIVGRLLAVGISHFLLSMCSKTKDVTLRELGFISWGGMIRGAIAFGLVLKIPDTSCNSEPEACF
jgi:NhaP-type Na+/H+ or K+/H+ antiporter